MKCFRYRLQTALNVARARERQAGFQLRSALAVFALAESGVERVGSRTRDAHAWLRKMVDRAQRIEALDLAEIVEPLNALRTVAFARRAAAGKAVAQARECLSERRTRYEVLARHRTRCVSAFEAALERDAEVQREEIEAACRTRRDTFPSLPDGASSRIPLLPF